MILPCRKNDLKSIKNFISVKILDFDGSFSSYQLLYGAKGNRIYLLGIGEKKDSAKIEEAFKKLCFNEKKYWKNSIQVKADNLAESELKKAVIGLESACYEIGHYKKKPESPKKLTVYFVAAKSISANLNEGAYIGETINKIKYLVDAPANIKTPRFLADWAKKSAKEYNYKCKIIENKALVDQKFDAVLAVGQGSVNPPVVIVTEYIAKPGAKIDIGLVGKGITFDSGGLSIKPSQNLHYMKSDMGGAGLVLGIMELVARLKLDINIVGVVASAENAVDASSYRPGDVINSHSGKSIEIIDTDAEGRLVLADGLSYIIKEFKPEQLIDFATLTGSVVRTLGNAAAGMFTNNTEMATLMSKLGNEVHERVWPLPLYSEFEVDLHSDIADIRNFSAKPIAGAINAAKFLEVFTEDHKKWMHLDIAGVSFGDSAYAKMKSATAFGVQLMLCYLKALPVK